MPRQQAINAIDQYIDIIIESFKNQSSIFEGFSMRDLHILAFVHREHENHVVTISELAYHLKVTPAAASQIVTSYENKGWLMRTRSKSDRRTVYISLTGDVRDIFSERRESLHKIFGEQLMRFSDDELQSFAKVLYAIDNKMHKFHQMK